jgi:transposase
VILSRREYDRRASVQARPLVDNVDEVAKDLEAGDVVLTDEERESLERWARRPKRSQALALRCRIVLACADEERSNGDVAAELGVTPTTVGKWRRRFVERRLEGLHDEPRPGVPRSITDDDVERVIVKTLEETPRDATHWSTRSMAKATGWASRASVTSGGPSV